MSEVTKIFTRINIQIYSVIPPCRHEEMIDQTMIKYKLEIFNWHFNDQNVKKKQMENERN